MVYGIVPAAGAGSRMRLVQDAPAKQYLPFGEGSVLTTTITTLQATGLFAGIVVVVPAADVDDVTEALHAQRLANGVHVIAGGAERQQSVHNGLNHVPADAEYIVVHDGVRPLATPDLIKQVLHTARQYGAAIAALPIHDTVKRTTDDGRISETVPRDGLYAVQTPQAFRADWLRQAHSNAQANDMQATDDAGLVEALGHPVFVVPGEAQNIKLTRPEDMAVAQNWQEQRQQPHMRVGLGYDVHRLVPDRPLILGGVTIPHTKGLLGHSDADVLTHAVMDALLGALALGDIGQHFPDTDPRYKDADSIALLRHVVALVAEHGYEPVQVDSVVGAQAPKLAPHIPAIRAALAEALGINKEAVAVKATTAEGLGFVGREEGMEARVVVMLQGRSRCCPSH